MTSPIGVVGLGIMGSAIAASLLRAGYEVVGYDIVPARSMLVLRRTQAVPKDTHPSTRRRKPAT